MPPLFNNTDLILLKECLHTIFDLIFHHRQNGWITLMVERFRSGVLKGPLFGIIYMVMPKKPTVNIQFLSNFVEVRPHWIVKVRLISKVPCQNRFQSNSVQRTCRRGVCEHHINFPSVLFELTKSVCIFLFTRFLLRPPGNAFPTQDLVYRYPAAETPGLRATEIIDMPPLLQVKN